jgi:hypothetical protein
MMKQLNENRVVGYTARMEKNIKAYGIFVVNPQRDSQSRRPVYTGYYQNGS